MEDPVPIPGPPATADVRLRIRVPYILWRPNPPEVGRGFYGELGQIVTERELQELTTPEVVAVWWAQHAFERVPEDVPAKKKGKK